MYSMKRALTTFPTHLSPARPPADLSPLPALLAAAPPFLGTALVLSHLLERALHERPARSSDAPAWFEAAAALIRECLQVGWCCGWLRVITPVHCYEVARVMSNVGRQGGCVVAALWAGCRCVG